MFYLQKAKAWLDAYGVDRRPPHRGETTRQPRELAAWRSSGLPLRRFFNTSGMLYRERNVKALLDAGMADEEAFALLAENGMLVKRPIVVGEDFVLVGFKGSRMGAERWRRRVGRRLPPSSYSVAVSSQSVKGPSFTRLTSMYAPKRPVSTCGVAAGPFDEPFVEAVRFVGCAGVGERGPVALLAAGVQRELRDHEALRRPRLPVRGSSCLRRPRRCAGALSWTRGVRLRLPCRRAPRPTGRRVRVQWSRPPGRRCPPAHGSRAADSPHRWPPSSRARRKAAFTSAMGWPPMPMFSSGSSLMVTRKNSGGTSMMADAVAVSCSISARVSGWARAHCLRR